MRSLYVTPAEANADLTISGSRISWNGKASDSLSDLTFSETRLRVAWDMVGLLGGRDWIVVLPILVPGRPTFVYAIFLAQLTKFLVPFVPDTVLVSEQLAASLLCAELRPRCAP